MRSRPRVNRVAVIHNADNAAAPGQLRTIEAAAPALGVQVTAAPVRSASRDRTRHRYICTSGANGGLVVLARLFHAYVIVI